MFLIVFHLLKTILQFVVVLNQDNRKCIISNKKSRFYPEKMFVTLQILLYSIVLRYYRLHFIAAN